MRRLLALSVVALAPLLMIPAAAHAQPGPRGGDGIRITEALDAVSAALVVTFVYDYESVAGKTMAISDRQLPDYEDPALWWRWLGHGLASAGLSWLVLDSELRLYHVMTIQEVGRHAHPVVTDPADLPIDAYWGTLVMQLDYVDCSSMQRALLNLCTRPGGVIQPLSGDSNGIMITDTCVQLRHFHDAVISLDRPRDHTIRVYDVPDTAIVGAMRELFAIEIERRLLAVSGVADGDGRARLYVRMAPALEAAVTGAVETIVGG